MAFYDSFRRVFSLLMGRERGLSFGKAFEVAVAGGFSGSGVGLGNPCCAIDGCAS